MPNNHSRQNCYSLYTNSFHDLVSFALKARRASSTAYHERNRLLWLQACLLRRHSRYQPQFLNSPLTFTTSSSRNNLLNDTSHIARSAHYFLSEMTNVEIGCGLSKILKYVEVLLENIRDDIPIFPRKSPQAHSALFIQIKITYFLCRLNCDGWNSSKDAQHASLAQLPCNRMSILGQTIISVTAVTATGSLFINSLYAPRQFLSCLGIDGRYNSLLSCGPQIPNRQLADSFDEFLAFIIFSFKEKQRIERNRPTHFP